MNLSFYPQLVKEWHPTKNGELTPDDITHGSGKKVWWLCTKGHSYEAKPNHRTGMKSNCPYCSGNRVNKENNFSVMFPDGCNCDILYDD